LEAREASPSEAEKIQAYRMEEVEKEVEHRRGREACQEVTYRVGERPGRVA